ncbi:MAG: hypothetical protein OXE05_03235 [Chloroflexi bacterium]|nr:hypothetical protein [Chloroflexota bacterium]
MSLLALAAMGVVSGLLATVGLQWPALVIAALFGVFTAGMLPLHSVVQAETPDFLRGRVLANLTMIKMLVMAGSAPLLQALIELTSATPVFLATGLAVLVSGVVLLFFREPREVRLVAPK